MPDPHEKTEPDSDLPRFTPPLGRGPPRKPGGPTPGQTWDKYLIVRLLAQGGQGEVFLGIDQFEVGGQVAIKIPRHAVPAEQIQAWIRSEVASLVKLDHPNIVRVVDAGCVEEIPFVATQLVEGSPLNEYRKVHQPTPDKVRDWALQLTDALALAHDAGIFHRDIKPRNIIVTADGRPVIIDFGIASLVGPYQAQREQAKGFTPLYAAPEQVRGDEHDHRADIFALGGVLKFLLDGTGPYGDVKTADKAAEAARSGSIEPADTHAGPALRRALARVANHAMAPDAQKRYSNAREMQRAIQAIHRRRRLLCASGLSAALIGLIALGAWGISAWWPRSSSGPTAPLPPPPVAAASATAKLEIHFQPADSDTDEYYILSPRRSPLRTGDCIQIHATLPRPLVAYLVSISPDGKLAVLYPPEGPKPQPTTKIAVPPASDEWLELSQPIGTETVILLACDQPLPSVDDLKQELTSLGPPPAFRSTDAGGLIIADKQGVRFIDADGKTQDASDLHRTIGPRVKKGRKGMLASLVAGVPRKWTLVRAVCFPHASAAASPSGSGGGSRE